MRAGHEVPLLIRASGEVLPAERGKGAPRALFEAVGLDEPTRSIAPGETLLIHSDGSTDMTDGRDELFGADRFFASVTLATAAATAQDFCAAIWRDLDAFRAGSPQADDVTLVALRCV